MSKRYKRVRLTTAGWYPRRTFHIPLSSHIQFVSSVNVLIPGVGVDDTCFEIEKYPQVCVKTVSSPLKPEALLENYLQILETCLETFSNAKPSFESLQNLKIFFTYQPFFFWNLSKNQETCLLYVLVLYITKLT